MTIQTALLQGRELLTKAGVKEARLTAEVLLAHAIGCERVWLVAHANDELREVWWIHYGRYLHERTQGRPTQYITKRQEFYGRDFRVTPDVLIPRPETEHLIEAVLALVPISKEHTGSVGTGVEISLDAARKSACATHRLQQDFALIRTILDVGTGSGAIAITLALETGSQVVACDISATALEVARGNNRSLRANLQLALCDLAAAFAPESFDIVASNPPYVAASDKPTLQREVRDFEPELALYGGEDGLDIYRRLIPDAWRVLRSGGWLVLEIGAGQGIQIEEMLRNWQDVAIRVDLAGLPRVALGRKR